MLVIPLQNSIYLKISIPLYEIQFTYVRSSGPGGQNVNKVSTKAVLRWNLLANQSLPEPLRQRLQEKLAAHLSEEGDLVLTSDRFRDQPRNREDCLEKLKERIASALFVPKARKKTKPSYSSQVRVKQAKAKNSQKKNLRGKVRGTD